MTRLNDPDYALDQPWMLLVMPYNDPDDASEYFRWFWMGMIMIDNDFFFSDITRRTILQKIIGAEELPFSKFGADGF